MADRPTPGTLSRPALLNPHKLLSDIERDVREFYSTPTQAFDTVALKILCRAATLYASAVSPTDRAFAERLRTEIYEKLADAMTRGDVVSFP